MGVTSQRVPVRDPRTAPLAHAQRDSRPTLAPPGPWFCGLQWRGRSHLRVCWGCYLCLHCPGSSETAPAPTSGHTQVSARASGGRLRLPMGPQARALLTHLCRPQQGTMPRLALRPQNPGDGRRPRTNESGPGRELYLWGRCTPQLSWLLCCTSVCRCGTTRGGDAPGLNLPWGRYGIMNETLLSVSL